LVTRSTFGSSLFGGALAAVAADVTWRRAVALDLTLLFLDAAVLRFRDFAMEGVDIFRLRWLAALDLTLARPKHRFARDAISLAFLSAKSDAYKAHALVRILFDSASYYFVANWRGLPVRSTSCPAALSSRAQ